MRENPSLQILLNPVASPTLADVSIDMSEKLRAELNKIFQFEVMGAIEFEGRNILNAMQKFASLAEESNILQIEYDTGEDNKTVYILSSMALEEVDNAIDFVKDQISENPQINCRKYAGIKEAVFNEESDYLFEKVGWFDLDNKRFLFIDHNVLFDFKCQMGLLDIPVVDRDLNYIPALGSNISETTRQIQKLSNAWGIELDGMHNPGQVVKAVPEYII